MLLRLACVVPLALYCGIAAADPASRIEHDLLPEQWIVGQAPKPAGLLDEMGRLHVPGLSIAVIHDGKIAWAKGYGMTTAGGAPITPDTLFEAGSISKPVTAVAAMCMVQDGALALDGTANGYLTGWKLPEGDAVTVRQLLSHTAGLNVHGFPGYAPGTPVPTLRQVLDGAAPAVTEAVRIVAQPGNQWSYSGGGYTVLQQLMIDVAGQPFDSLMAQRVLQPLGMKNSTFMQPAGPAILARAAMPHDDDGKPYPAGPFIDPELAAAGLWSTPSDLATFLIAVQRAAAGRTDQILTPRSAQALLTPVLSGYALGFSVDGSGDATTFAHGGHNQGYQTTMVAYAGRGDGVVVMTNGNNGDQIADALVRAVAKEYRWPSYKPVARTEVALAPAQSAPLAGKYTIPGQGAFLITYDKGELLYWQAPGDSEHLYAESATHLFVLSHKLEIILDGPGAATGKIVSGQVAQPFARGPR